MPHAHRYRCLRPGLATLPLGAGVVMLVGLASAGPAGCVSHKPEPTWAGAKNLHFSEDARDPTERRDDDPFWKFEPQPDGPVGTADPLSPDRRTQGFGEADNPPR